MGADQTERRPMDRSKSHSNPYSDSGVRPRLYWQTPNIIDDLNLSLATFRVYCHLKRVTGEGGISWKSTGQIAEHCKVSKSTVVRAKKELEYLGLIEIHINPQSESHRHHIEIVDIWQQNILAYPGTLVEQRGTLTEQGGTDPLLTKKTPLKKTPLKNILPVESIDHALMELPGWDDAPAETILWKQRFQHQFPLFVLNDIEACRDFHGEDVNGARMTGRWKVRLRQWMLHKRPGKETDGQRTGSTGSYPGQDREAANREIAASVGAPLHGAEQPR